MQSGMFKSADTHYRYKLDLTFLLSESRQTMSILLEAGHGFPEIGDKKEFHYMRCRSYDVLDVPFSAADMHFNHVDFLVSQTFDGHFYRVYECNIKVSFEDRDPIIIQEKEIDCTAAVNYFEKTKSTVLSKTNKDKRCVVS